jgi:TPR repeat protein
LAGFKEIPKSLLGVTVKIAATFLTAAVVAGALFIRHQEAGFRSFYGQDFINARLELEPMAEKGDRLAAYFLGRIYLLGLKTGKDGSLAKKWFLLSARKGLLDGAVMYLNTELLEKESSPDKCSSITELLSTAARAKNIHAILSLGNNYAKGICGRKDLVKSAYHYALARNMDKTYGQLSESAANQLSPDGKSQLNELVNNPLRPISEQQFLSAFLSRIDGPGENQGDR